MKLKVINLDNAEVGSVELNEGVFGVPLRSDILYSVVRWQQAKKQAGTHKTKTISEIRGTTAKPHAQKGTGRARQGSKRSAQFRGGSTIFGPVVRSHAYSLPKKIRILGLKMALSSKAASGDILILENTELPEAKTSALSKKLGSLGVTSALIIDNGIADNFKKAASNIKHIDVLESVGSNVYDILNSDKLIITQAALKQLEERLA
jgi:large subunit ribosomal protein L4